MNSNSIRARLLLTSTALSPDELSGLTGLVPERIGRMGEHLGKNSGPLRKHNSWYFSTERVFENLETGPLLGDLLNQLLDKIEPTSSAWIPLVETDLVQATIIGEVQVDATYSPAIEIMPSTITRISQLGAKMTFDFYWHPVPQQTSS